MMLHFAAMAILVAFPQYGRTTPCEAHAGASVVFSGVVVRTSTAPAPDSGLDEMRTRSRAMPLRQRLVTFRVERTFLGSPEDEMTIVDHKPSGEAHLREGERYLVYATDREERSPGARVRAVPLAEAAGDLAYFGGIGERRGGAVTGRVGRIDFDAPRDAIVELAVPGVEIVLERDGARYTARTGDDGTFELREVAAGRYQVRTDPPVDTSSAHEGAVSVPERGCVRLSFRILAHGVVSGRLVDDEGAPAQGVDVMLVPAGRGVRSGNYFIRTTDAAGAFRFEGMPAGLYDVGAEIVTPTYGPGAYGPVFFPGVGERAAAGRIRLEKDGEADAGVLRLPPRPPTRGVEGRVVSKAGLPERSVVAVRHARAVEGHERTVDVDASGRFRFEALEGESYILEARAGALVSAPVHQKVEGHVTGVVLEIGAGEP